MTRLRAFREDGHPFLLIGIWSLLEVASLVWIAQLPGEPHYEGSGIGSLGAGIVVAVFLVALVAFGSRIAWWLAIFTNTLGIALGAVGAVLDFGVKPIGLALISAAALWLIWTGSIERYVLAGKRRAIAPPPAH